MPIRRYFCPLVGAGTAADPFRPAGIPAGVSWQATDARTDATLPAGELLVEADVTAAQHAAILATVGVAALPFEDGLGAPLGDGEDVAATSAANRATIRATLEARGVPADDLSDAVPVRQWLRRFRRRMVLRHVLGADDFPLGLDTLVSALTPAQRQAIRTKLLVHGIDTTGAGIVGTDTIRAALRKAFVASGGAATLFQGL